MENPTTHSKRPHKMNNSTPVISSPAQKKAKSEEAKKDIALKTTKGVATYMKLIEESNIFIDKSLLIKDFLNHPAKVLLITCPRRWGKSINMDMIKTFLEIQVDENGNKHLDKTKCPNYKLFRGEINSKKRN